MSKSENRATKRRETVIDERFTKASKAPLMEADGITVRDLKNLTAAQLNEKYDLAGIEGADRIKLKPMKRQGAQAR